MLCKSTIILWKEKLVFDKNIVPLQYINFKNTAIMILTTTPTVEGHSIKEYKGIVTSRAVFGANAFKDMFAGLRDIVGGRVNSYEKVFMKAQETAMKICRKKQCKEEQMLLWEYI